MAKDNEKLNAYEPHAICSQLPDVVDIKPMIHVIRGQQVMVDRDLAPLYGVQTKKMRPQVGAATEDCLTLSRSKGLPCLVLF